MLGYWIGVVQVGKYVRCGWDEEGIRWSVCSCVEEGESRLSGRGFLEG